MYNHHTSTRKKRGKIMINKPMCYISYCHEDIPPKRMEIIIKWLQKICEDKITFLCDWNVKFSETFADFEKKIYSADSILIFFLQTIKKGA